MASSRREFFRGQWGVPPARSADQAGKVEIVSLIVGTWPTHLEAVSKAILALGNAEIRGRDPNGKLIVVLEEATKGAVGAKMNAISGLPHVLSAAMVFQASDDGEGIG
jgi:nitrate reductase NapAB chaperone NapD